MKKVSCLYVEDETAHQARFALAIETAWTRLRPKIPIDISFANSPEEALPKLRSGTFNLLIVDVLFKADKVEKIPRGLHLITRVRQEFGQGIAIVALSADGNYSEDAKIAKADAFLPKRFIDSRDANYERLGAVLLEVLQKGEEPLPLEEIEWALAEGDVRLRWLVEHVGRGTIAGLASKIIGQPLKRINVGFVRSGLSGAAVLRLNCEAEVGERSVPRRDSILLKVSRERALLAKESANAEEIGGLLFQRFVPLVGGSGLHESGGWYGIGLRFLENAKTMADWLADDSASSVVASMRELLSDGGMRDVYRSYRRGKAPIDDLFELITPARAANIVLALEELTQLAVDHGGSDLLKERVVRDFAERKYRPKMRLPTRWRDSFITLCHGDLHARNILADRNKRLYLVDAGSVGELAWPADISRLFVDLFISIWDEGSPSHEWELLPDWVRISKVLLSGKELDNEQIARKNRPVLTALNWIRGNLSEMHPDVFDEQSAFEFSFAVAIEFLRASYRRMDLPSPKRVLGLLAFFVALERSEELLSDLR